MKQTRLLAVLWVVLALAVASSELVAQRAESGRIVGRVVDAETGRPLTGAQLTVQGTAAGTLAGVDGRYILVNVPAGSQALEVRYLGYAAKVVTGVEVPAGGAANLDIALDAQAVALDALVVSAEREKGTVSRVLDEQRRAVGIISAVGSEQISRSPDGDAAQAVQRVSGVTVRDGGLVFVRGLGERYTTTSLNGARLPSPDPERRVVPLDLFPSALLQSVSTLKTFTPNLAGDFGGAQVDVATREFPIRRQLVISTSTGFNDAAARQDVLIAPRFGGEWLARGSGDRNPPALVASPAAIRQLVTDDAMREAVQQLHYDVRPSIGTGLPNSSFGVSLGGQDPVFGRAIGYVGSVTYSFAQEVRDNEVRANPIMRDGAPQVLEEWRGSTGRTSATMGGVLNLSTLIGLDHRVSLNNTFTRAMDNEAREDAGYTDYFQVPTRRSTIRYVERTIRSSQLAAEHSLAQRHHLQWNVAAARVTRREPDRTDLVYVRHQAADGEYWGVPIGDTEALRRTFGDLTESNYSASTDYRLALRSGARPWEVRAGGLYRYTERDAEAFQFSVIPSALPPGANAGSPDEVFGLAGNGSARFRIAGASETGAYQAREHLGAGYIMAEVPLGSRLRLIGGGRVESANLELDTELVSGVRRPPVRRADVDVLPSLIANYSLSERQSLRLSVTQTLARPEYRELSPVAELNVIGDVITKGNERLRRSLIRNLDVKWELHPGAGEVVSIGLFGKHFSRPIERVDVATGGPPQVTFVNADAAYNVGAELELRKSLAPLSHALAPFSVLTNLTLMHSRIDLGEGESANTNASRPMIGQAPYVINAGLNYLHPAGGSATLLYNVVGRRIWAAGSLPYPDIYEQPRQLLDLSVRLPLWGGINGRFDARNLLDAPSVLRQATLERERYNSGRVFTFGVSWSPGL